MNRRLLLPDFRDLRTQFLYCEESGRLQYRKINNRVRESSNEAGGVVHQGEGRTPYRVVTVEYPSGKSRQILAHRVIWKLMEAEEPPEEIDHIDGDGLNNRWDNLRDGTQCVNARNRVIHSDNRTGLNGVSFRAGKWEPFYSDEGRRVYLGRYKDKQEAARLAEKLRLQNGYTKRHGKKRRI